MKKWETLRIHIDREAHRIGQEIDKAILTQEWGATRDIALQMVGISSVLYSMNSIENIKEHQQNEAEIEKIRLRAKRDRKRDKRATNLRDNMEESPV